MLIAVFGGWYSGAYTPGVSLKATTQISVSENLSLCVLGLGFVFITAVLCTGYSKLLYGFATAIEQIFLVGS